MTPSPSAEPDPNADETAPIASDDAGVHTARQPLVLIVDDYEDARILYSDYLAVKGFRTAVAADGLEAIAMAAVWRPDIIVMDLSMPRLDGWSAVEQLTAADATRDIPIIALSAVPFAADSARELGCAAFLAKPCSPELLRCTLQVILAQTQGTASSTSPPTTSS